MSPPKRRKSKAKVAPDGTLDIKLERPGGFWRKTKKALHEEDPSAHKLRLKGQVKEGLARRHIISSKEVLDHYNKNLNKKPLPTAQQILEGTKHVKVEGKLGAPSLLKAAKTLVKAFFNDTENLWVGDSAENSSIQEARDFPEDWSAAEKRNHVAKIKRKYFLKT